MEHKKGTASQHKRNNWSDYRARMIRDMNLEVKAFTCKRGDTFIWHGGLLHGGLEVHDENSTRKSYVVHYSTAAHTAPRRATMKMRFGREGRDFWRVVGGTTERTIERDGCLGLDNPLREMKVPRFVNARRLIRRGRRALRRD
jgi:hypothetical protein